MHRRPLSLHIAPCLPAEMSLTSADGASRQWLFPDKNQLLVGKLSMSAPAVIAQHQNQKASNFTGTETKPWLHLSSGVTYQWRKQGPAWLLALPLTCCDLCEGVFCACRKLMEQFSPSVLGEEPCRPSQLPPPPGPHWLSFKFYGGHKYKKKKRLTQLRVLITEEPSSVTFPYCPFASLLLHNLITLSSADPWVLPGKCQSHDTQRWCMDSRQQTAESTALGWPWLLSTCPPHHLITPWLSPHLHREQGEHTASHDRQGNWGTLGYLKQVS